MNVLVTGGAGFIGSHLVDELLVNGHNVTVLDNLSTGLKSNIDNIDKITFYKEDISSDNLSNIFHQGQFDALVHLAGQTMVNKSIENPYFDAQVNILGGLNLLELCRKNNVKRVVFASTAAVYGDTDVLPIAEDCQVKPMSFYGLSKLSFEQYLDIYNKNFGLEYVVLRFANVYGEKQGDGGEGGVISIFANKIATNQQITVFGDGSQTRDFIYARDIATGILCSLQTQNFNSVYNLSNKQEITVNTLIELLAKVSGKSINQMFAKARQGDIHRSMLDNQKAIIRLNWQPKTPLFVGLEKTFNYFLSKRY